MTLNPTTIALSRIHYPVYVLGPGVRAALWTQGCSIRCDGCIARHTWGATGGNTHNIADIMVWLDNLPSPLTGVTISGGEPTDQPLALTTLLHALTRHRWGAAHTEPVDVLVYTGQPQQWVNEHADLFEGADVVIAEPFERRTAGYLPLRGSDNQVLIPLTDLGQARYVNQQMPERNQVQLAMIDGQLHTIGIPTPGVMAAITADAARHGLTLTGASWTR